MTQDVSNLIRLHLDQVLECKASFFDAVQLVRPHEMLELLRLKMQRKSGH